MTAARLGCKRTMVETGWAFSCPGCMSRIRTRYSYLLVGWFLAGKASWILSGCLPTESADYCRLVNEWAWLSLKVHLGSVLESKLRQKWKMVHYRRVYAKSSLKWKKLGVKIKRLTIVKHTISTSFGGRNTNQLSVLSTSSATVVRVDSARNIQISLVIVYAKENYNVATHYHKWLYHLSCVNLTTDAHTAPRGQCSRLSESLLQI